MMKTSSNSNTAFAFIILCPIILSLPILPGCSSPAETVEPSLAEQLTAIRNGSTDIVLVESTPLSDQDLALIRDVPGLRVLQLDHADNKLTDAGMKEIAKLPQLEHLRIRGGSIGDDGLKALAKMPNLKALNLPQGRFTDAGLAQLKELPKLEMLRIGSPKVCVVTICRMPRAVTGTISNGASAAGENSSSVMRSRPVTWRPRWVLST